MDRELDELGGLAGQREIEEVIDGLGPVRLQVEHYRLGELTVGNRHGADRKLDQHGQPLPGGRRVGDDYLTAVDGLNQELAGDELVDFFAVFLPVAISQPIEVLADEDGSLRRLPRCLPNFFVEGDRRSGWRERHPAGLELHVMLTGFKWKVEHGQREEYLGEIARGIGEMPG